MGMCGATGVELVVNKRAVVVRIYCCNYIYFRYATNDRSWLTVLSTRRVT